MPPQVRQSAWLCFLHSVHFPSHSTVCSIESFNSIPQALQERSLHDVLLSSQTASHLAIGLAHYMKLVIGNCLTINDRFLHCPGYISQLTNLSGVPLFHHSSLSFPLLSRLICFIQTAWARLPQRLRWRDYLQRFTAINAWQRFPLAWYRFSFGFFPPLDSWDSECITEHPNLLLLGSRSSLSVPAWSSLLTNPSLLQVVER
eukprot:Gb_27749 [translate_table: standard]